MSITINELHSDNNFCLITGTATADTDTVSLQLNAPMSTFTVEGSRPDSGGFSFTLQSSVLGLGFEDIATCTTTGKTDIVQAVDKPSMHLKIQFSDVASQVVTFGVLGVK